ncbi:MAG: patatin-like phospholipase family protein, partial [Planctomycetota bacterium]
RRFSGSVSAAIVNLLLAGLGLWLATSCPLSPTSLSIIEPYWPLPGGFIRMTGFIAAMVALWLGAGTWVGPGLVLDGANDEGPTVQRRVRVWRRTGEVLSILLLSTLLLEVVWVAVELSDAIEMSVYTVWAFLSLAFASTLLAALLDFLYRNTYWPWRFITALMLVLGASFTSHVQLGSADLQALKTQPDAQQQNVTSLNWVEAAINRLESQPKGPVIIVTASGGGSRAAMVTALSLKIIEDEFRQDGGHPACMWIGSGVSGGGLALAAHYYPSTWQSSAQDAVSRDYLGPIFRGFLVPFSNRGESLTAYWDRAFPWQSIRQDTLDQSKPLLLFGIADIDTGRRMVAGFPMLPSAWLSRWEAKPRGGDIKWVLEDNAHAPYSLSNLRVDGGQPNIHLTRAVRMSSAFPFGLEPTRVTVDVPGQNDQTSDQVHFLDGGMVDNTGIDSVVAVLAKIKELETANGKRIEQELRRRGILLVEIDAGAGSNEVSRSGLLSRLTQPFRGYNRGVYSAAKRAREQNFNELEYQYKENFVTEPIISHPANDNVTEIMTSFALSKSDIKRLVDSFVEGENRIRDSLHGKYEALSDR